MQEAPRSSFRTKGLSDVKYKVPKTKVYQPAYISDSGALIRLPEYMTYGETLIALGCAELVYNLVAFRYDSSKSSELQRKVEKMGKQWGIYTHDQAHAKLLALSLGCTYSPEVHGSGMYGHYNITGPNGNHVFHIWFGGVQNY